MSFPIVGVGASAGGLESISAVLAGIPASRGMAYVFVQHAFIPAVLNCLEFLQQSSDSESRPSGLSEKFRSWPGCVARFNSGASSAPPYTR
jgi:hypothetical protein